MVQPVDTHSPFDDLEPADLERGITSLLHAYSQNRSGLLAWFVCRYAQALVNHPDFEGTDEERCAWHRLAHKWRWLAQTGGQNRIVFKEVAA